MTTLAGPERQMAQVEAGRVLRNPLLWLAFLLSAEWLRGSVQMGNAEDWHNLLVGFGLVLPGFVMVGATVLALLRSRYANTDELWSTVPVSRDRRSVGHGLSALVAILVGLAWMAVLFVTLRPGAILGATSSTVPAGLEIPRPNGAQLLQGPVAVVAVCCLGLALASWVRSWLLLVPLGLAAMLQVTVAGPWSGTTTSLANWLAPISQGWVNGEWVGCGADDSGCVLQVAGFDRITPWWHLGYLVALSVTFVATAVLRDRRDRTAWMVFGVSLITLAGFVIAQALVYQRYTPVAGG